MMLSSYIKELLYRYDCVIVPNFGGFVTNTTHTQLIDGTFYPPSKQISFNAQLTHNDGLLANEIASALKISFEEAVQQIVNTVSDWKATLNSESIVLEEVGTLALNEEKQITFEPKTSTNFLTSSFGLSPVASSIIERNQEVIALYPEQEVENELVTSTKEVVKKPFAFTKYAAAAAVLLVGAFGVNQFVNQNTAFSSANEQKLVEEKIQKATFIIDDELPAINLNIAKETPQEVFIIAGAFQLEKNANKKIAKLKKKGYDAKVIGKNKWGLTQVSVGSYSSKEEALEVIDAVREDIGTDAWILVK
ncbi:HU domain-containing protein [Tenacibaculum agarivorans]|uniref:HU domain-containing protein n=1 Tax=Tenacibaculum agarivorans TaxID=1908389 RepID=UPI00094B9B6F|nr:SPOR domain-containing protein [Tenacibaculum agarivorans]